MNAPGTVRTPGGHRLRTVSRESRLDALHSKVDDLAGSVSGMASSAAGGQGGSQQASANLQQLTPSRMPPRDPTTSPMAVQSQRRAAANDLATTAGQQLRTTRASFADQYARRQQASASGGIAPNGTINGQSEAHNAATFGNQLKTSNGQGSSYETRKWFGQ
jgi:hypothetical protein